MPRKTQRKKSPSPERTYLTPSVPVEAGPGSEEKIVAMQERNSRGEQLWHEADGTLCERIPACHARTAGNRVPDFRNTASGSVARVSDECGMMPSSDSII